MLLSRTLEDKLANLYRAGGRLVGGCVSAKARRPTARPSACRFPKAGTFSAPSFAIERPGLPGASRCRMPSALLFGSALGPMKGRDGNVHRGRRKKAFPR